jgi:hypothetical protein
MRSKMVAALSLGILMGICWHAVCRADHARIGSGELCRKRLVQTSQVAMALVGGAASAVLREIDA